MTLDEFQRHVFNAALASPICRIPTVRRLTPTSISLRLTVTIGGFIDTYFNEQTGTMAYALIQHGLRVFGADNTGGWHIHPLGNADSHERLQEEMSFAEFIAEIERKLVSG